AKADELYQQLKAGAKFDELARKQSNGSTADQGGDLGYFKRNDLAKQLEDQSFALKAGEFTQPIRTRQGFVILRVDDRIEAGTPSLDRIHDQIQDQIYSLKVQPALREYLTKLREDAYIDVKPGYTDSGASPNQTKLIYAADTGPQTKQVRGKLGMGKKKTIVVVGGEKNDHSAAAGSTSELGSAKSEVDSKQKALADRKAAQDAAAAKAVADAAEKEKLSHMTRKERSKYLAQKKREAKKEAKLQHQEKLKQKEAAEQEAQNKADEAKAAKSGKKSGNKSAKAAPAGTSQQADAGGKDKTGSVPAKAEVAPKPAAVTPQEAKAAKAAEKEKLSHMTRKQRAQYLAQKKRDEKLAKASKPKPADTSQQADASAPPKKKKSISWF
ncbi:MAG: peptidylprolyl isomerase, partial [Gallionellaceae bacterium]